MGHDDEPLTLFDIYEMKERGEPKPAIVKPSVWECPKKNIPNHHPMIYLSAIGLSNEQISKELNISQEKLTYFLRMETIRAEVDDVRSRFFASEYKLKLAHIIPKSFQVLQDIMENEKEKGSTRVAAAAVLQDRHLGKASQPVDVQVNLVRQVFERLDQRDRDKAVIDVTPDGTKQLHGKIEPEKPLDSVDQWVSQNLGDKK